jgi:hypothetical protein
MDTRSSATDALTSPAELAPLCEQTFPSERPGSGSAPMGSLIVALVLRAVGTTIGIAAILTSALLFF